MNVKKHLFALGLVAVMASPALAAEDILPPSDSSPFSITGNVAGTTEYFFRGYSQSDDSPAVSGGLNLNYKLTDDITATAGVWSSSIASSTANGSVEADLILGVAGAIGDFGWNVGSTWYTYPGSNNGAGNSVANESDFWEGSLGASYNWGLFTTAASYAYSPDFALNSGTAHYINGKVIVPVKYVDLSAAVGRQYIENNAAFGASDYNDFKVAGGFKVFGLDMEIAYLTTSLDHDRVSASADNQFVYTVTKNF